MSPCAPTRGHTRTPGRAAAGTRAGASRPGPPVQDARRVLRDQLAHALRVVPGVRRRAVARPPGPAARCARSPRNRPDQPQRGAGVAPTRDAPPELAVAATPRARSHAVHIGDPARSASSRPSLARAPPRPAARGRTRSPAPAPSLLAPALAGGRRPLNTQSQDTSTYRARTVRAAASVFSDAAREPRELGLALVSGPPRPARPRARSRPARTPSPPHARRAVRQVRDRPCSPRRSPAARRARCRAPPALLHRGGREVGAPPRARRAGDEVFRHPPICKETLGSPTVK